MLLNLDTALRISFQNERRDLILHSCFDENCSYTHLKGTVRQKDTTDNFNSEVIQKGKRSSNLQTEKRHNSTELYKHSFLELKGLVTSMTQELRNEINNLKSQMQMEIIQNKTPVPQAFQVGSVNHKYQAANYPTVHMLAHSQLPPQKHNWLSTQMVKLKIIRIIKSTVKLLPTTSQISYQCQ